jgi:hypothetical protein
MISSLKGEALCREAGCFWGKRRVGKAYDCCCSDNRAMMPKTPKWPGFRIRAGAKMSNSAPSIRLSRLVLFSWLSLLSGG